MPRAEHPATPFEDLQARRNWVGPVVGGVLTQALIDFCHSGVAVIVGCRTEDGKPLGGLALAVRIDAEGAVRIFLREPANVELLKALRAGSPVAATFTEPRTHRSIQIKGARAAQVDVEADDLALVAHQTGIFRGELENASYPARFAAYYCAYREDELAAIEFMPRKAFVQTPGPGAGSLLEP